MNFREALEREIAEQGLSVAEIAKKSGVSRGAIYNILNGTTEDDRVRPATRRSIAEACNRLLRVEEDGGVMFVLEDSPVRKAEVTPHLRVAFAPGRTFIEAQHVREGFDWIYREEEKGRITGIDVVDRVFQKRSDFLSLVVDAGSAESVAAIAFDLAIEYVDGPKAALSVSSPLHADTSGRAEATVFVSAGPPFSLRIENVMCTTASGESRSVPHAILHTHPAEADRD